MEEHLILLPVREFPDRGTKWLLESPEHVAGLLQILTPELASRLDFSRLQPQNVSFILDSLRKQESDLLFLVPFKGIAGETEWEILIYILIEHQSTLVLSMGFRILFYMTLIWDRQRQEWQRAGLPESEWRFRPIVPILFYTGDKEWDTPLSVTALMDVPAELERFIPHHEALFLNLNATAPEQLTQKEHPFGWIARVLKQETAPDEAFMNELREAVARIDQLTADKRAEWQKAIHYFLLLIFHRREPEEHEQLTEIIKQSVQDRSRQEEVSQMRRTIAQAFIEEGEQRGIERGQVETTQANTLDVLNARFAVSPSTVAELTARLEQIQELPVLRQLHLDAVKVESLDSFIQRLSQLQG
ncbi:MAG TPA: Rpn family recombination-promoting nuclease/putative transposase [Bacteroidota bacterium]|nr:Rpn family recombination-promoting nuclease/putative transposase [Bacteroidota bacterium]